MEHLGVVRRTAESMQRVRDLMLQTVSDLSGPQTPADAAQARRAADRLAKHDAMFADEFVDAGGRRISQSLAKRIGYRPADIVAQARKELAH